MAVKRGLGKGLDSLITPKVPSQKTQENAAAQADAGTHENDVIFVPVGKIEPNRTQPRKHFDEDALQELSESIRQHGILQPLLVRRRDDYYEIIAGERRWRAARLADLKEVPVLIKDVSDQERSELALIENLQRSDLDPIEEASAFAALIEEYGLTQEEAANRVSKSRTAVTNSMRLLKLDPRVQEMLRAQQISAGHARALLTLEDKERQFRLAQQATEKGLSVREVEKRVRQEKERDTSAPEVSPPDPAQEQREAVYRKITDQLRERLGTKVEILEKNGAGKIEISYYSPDELERILELLQS